VQHIRYTLDCRGEEKQYLEAVYNPINFKRAALGDFTANFCTERLTLPSICLITIGDTLEPLLGARLLGTWQNFSIALDKPRDVMRNFYS